MMEFYFDFGGDKLRHTTEDPAALSDDRPLLDLNALSSAAGAPGELYAFFLPDDGAGVGARVAPAILRASYARLTELIGFFSPALISTGGAVGAFRDDLTVTAAEFVRAPVFEPGQPDPDGLPDAHFAVTDASVADMKEKLSSLRFPVVATDTQAAAVCAALRVLRDRASKRTVAVVLF